uniref:Uncharacterized protein n=1 Tax=Oryza punctata TaxID=4537 RepID=A0A0E0KY93_ORYPU
MGSWVRTIITSPFRKARTILNNQQSNSGSIGNNDEHRHRAKKQRRHSSGATPSSTTMARGGDDAVEAQSRSSQLYGDVMACAYEDVQVMWSMLDNKSRLCAAATS